MKKGLSSNLLKIIAIIIMIIDHIGLYMYNKLDQETYYLLRSIRKNVYATIRIFNSARLFAY